MSADKSNLLQKILLGVVITICVVLAGIGTVIWENTLVAWWLPVVIALAVAAALLPLGMIIWPRLTRSDSRLTNILLHLGCVWAIIYFLILFINMKGVDPSSAQTLTATIERKYSKEHTRNSGRRHRAQTHYFTYHATLLLPDGRRKERQIQLDRFNRLRTGAEVDVTVSRGLLGMQVIHVEKEGL